MQTPVGIDRARHYDLTGRSRHVWWRRIALCFITALPVLALGNVFGQHATTQTTDSAAAQLAINSPVQCGAG